MFTIQLLEVNARPTDFNNLSIDARKNKICNVNKKRFAFIDILLYKDVGIEEHPLIFHTIK